MRRGGGGGGENALTLKRERERWRNRAQSSRTARPEPPLGVTPAQHTAPLSPPPYNPTQPQHDPGPMFSDPQLCPPLPPHRPAFTSPGPPQSFTLSFSSIYMQPLALLPPQSHSHPHPNAEAQCPLTLTCILASLSVSVDLRGGSKDAAASVRTCVHASPPIGSRGGRLVRLMHRTCQTAPVSPLFRVFSLNIQYSVFR